MPRHTCWPPQAWPLEPSWASKAAGPQAGRVPNNRRKWGVAEGLGQAQGGVAACSRLPSEAFPLGKGAWGSAQHPGHHATHTRPPPCLPLPHPLLPGDFIFTLLNAKKQGSLQRMEIYWGALSGPPEAQGMMGTLVSSMGQPACLASLSNPATPPQRQFRPGDWGHSILLSLPKSFKGQE